MRGPRPVAAGTACSRHGPADEPALAPPVGRPAERGSRIRHAPGVPGARRGWAAGAARGRRLSADRTCGACHDAAYIDSPQLAPRRRGRGGLRRLPPRGRRGPARRPRPTTPRASVRRAWRLRRRWNVRALPRPRRRPRPLSLDFGSGCCAGDGTGQLRPDPRTGEIFAAQTLRLAASTSRTRPGERPLGRARAAARDLRRLPLRGQQPGARGLSRTPGCRSSRSDPRACRSPSSSASGPPAARGRLPQCHDAGEDPRLPRLPRAASRGAGMPGLPRAAMCARPAAHSIDATVVTLAGRPPSRLPGRERARSGASLNTAFLSGYAPLLLPARTRRGAAASRPTTRSCAGPGSRAPTTPRSPDGLCDAPSSTDGRLRPDGRRGARPQRRRPAGAPGS